MKNNKKTPETINSIVGFKRKFSFGEMYHAFVFLPRAISKMRENRKINGGGLYMYKLTVDGITKAVSKSILLK